MRETKKTPNETKFGQNFTVNLNNPTNSQTFMNEFERMKGSKSTTKKKQKQKIKEKVAYFIYRIIVTCVCRSSSRFQYLTGQAKQSKQIPIKIKYQF